MENPTIGIKIADGSYFPILEEGNSKRKRLVLTTVNDNQESVQIDLYKGQGEEFLDAVYVGSLLIENIVPGLKESSEIELKIGFDQAGNLNQYHFPHPPHSFACDFPKERQGQALEHQPQEIHPNHLH